MGAAGPDRRGHTWCIDPRSAAPIASCIRFSLSPLGSKIFLAAIYKGGRANSRGYPRSRLSTVEGVGLVGQGKLMATLPVRRVGDL